MIVDSSVLIHLSRIGKLTLLKDFFGKVLITEDVYRETVDEAKGRTGASAIEKACGKWIVVQKLKKKKAIDRMVELEGIEGADASLILLAEESGDKLLSNDHALIRVARARGVECWWLTSFVLNAYAKGTITKKKAKQVLLELVESGLRLAPEVYASMLRQLDAM
ncbi:MAG: hypothetical protein KAI64_07685 [Thermoplasmata archaeon]|nr:hypothetical protein [Thermoplasmata archaeon]